MGTKPNQKGSLVEERDQDEQLGGPLLKIASDSEGIIGKDWLEPSIYEERAWGGHWLLLLFEDSVYLKKYLVAPCPCILQI